MEAIERLDKEIVILKSLLKRQNNEISMLKEQVDEHIMDHMNNDRLLDVNDDLEMLYE